MKFHTNFAIAIQRLRREKHKVFGNTRLAILQFIAERRKIRLPPTICEIGNHLGLSGPYGIHCHLKALKKQGLIHYEEGKKRTLTPRFKFIPASELEVKHEQTNPTL